MYEPHSIHSQGGELPAPGTPDRRRPQKSRPHDGPHAPEKRQAAAVNIPSSSTTRRTVGGPPPPGGPMALLDTYHDQLSAAVRHATERGFVRSWGQDGLPQVKVFVGARDARGRPECLLVLRSHAAFDFAWRMYDWAMGLKRDAEQARDGSCLAPWRPNALRRAS